MKYISLDGLKRAFEQIVNYVKAQIKSNVTDKLGVASGIATLGTDGKLTSGQLPSIDKTYVGLGNVTNEAQIPLSQKGATNGVATLGTDGRIPSSQLPSYVDDVLEYNGKSTFPATGETGKIYVDTSTNKTYRWSGTAYVEISASLALGETSSTAYAGDKGATLATKVSDLEKDYDNLPTIIIKDIQIQQNSPTDVNVAIKAYDRLNNVQLDASEKIESATGVKAGLISGSDKTKLDGIEAGANAYSHPAGSAASKAEGLYKISTDAQSHVASVAAVTKSDITALGIPAQDTTYSIATTSANGLMSASDKTKLDGIVTATDTEIDAIFAEVTA